MSEGGGRSFTVGLEEGIVAAPPDASLCPAVLHRFFWLILGVLVLFIQGMNPKTRDSYCLKLLRDHVT